MKLLQWLRSEIYVFLTALMFYTRIPIVWRIPFTETMLNVSVRYFPLVGAIVGAMVAGIFVGLSYILPYAVALVLSLCFSWIITGAFHEDGFADFCDAFGSFVTKEKALLVMKDSRLGTYGVLGTIGMVAAKFSVLYHIPVQALPYSIVFAHVASRVFPAWIIHFMQYVRLDDSSKSKPVGEKSSIFNQLCASIIVLPFLFFYSKITCISLLVAICVSLCFSWYLYKRIGGYTGDSLGALQQIIELAIYLTFLSYFFTHP